MKNKWICALAALLLALPLWALGESKPRVILYFFHSNPCEACHKVDNLYRIADETGAGTQACLVVKEYREYTSDFRAETEAVAQWFDLGRTPQTPFLVVGNTILEGYDAIREGLPAAVKEAVDSACSFSEENVAEYGSLKEARFAAGETSSGKKLVTCGILAGTALIGSVAVRAWRRGKRLV